MLVYRNAQQKDLAVIYEIYRKAVFRYEDPTVVDLKRVLEGMERSLQYHLDAMTAAEVDGEAIAFYSLRNEQDGTVLLEDFTVVPAYRRKGYGTQVLAHCMKEADGMVYRYVHVGNTAETVFYEKNGFHTVKMISPTRCVMARDPYKKR